MVGTSHIGPGPASIFTSLVICPADPRAHGVGCNLCSIVCPVDNCIIMTLIDTGREKVGWSDYQDRLAAGQMTPLPPHP